MTRHGRPLSSSAVRPRRQRRCRCARLRFVVRTATGAIPTRRSRDVVAQVDPSLDAEWGSTSLRRSRGSAAVGVSRSATVRRRSRSRLRRAARRAAAIALGALARLDAARPEDRLGALETSVGRSTVPSARVVVDSGTPIRPRRRRSWFRRRLRRRRCGVNLRGGLGAHGHILAASVPRLAAMTRHTPDELLGGRATTSSTTTSCPRNFGERYSTDHDLDSLPRPRRACAATKLATPAASSSTA